MSDPMTPGARSGPPKSTQNACLSLCLSLQMCTCRWVPWKEQCEALLDPTKVAIMGPNALIPFGMPSLVAQVGRWCEGLLLDVFPPEICLPKSTACARPGQGLLRCVCNYPQGCRHDCLVIRHDPTIRLHTCLPCTRPHLQTSPVPHHHHHHPGSPASAALDFVFTADNLPAIYLMRLLLAAKANVLLMGPTGVSMGSRTFVGIFILCTPWMRLSCIRAGASLARLPRLRAITRTRTVCCSCCTQEFALA